MISFDFPTAETWGWAEKVFHAGLMDMADLVEELEETEGEALDPNEARFVLLREMALTAPNEVKANLWLFLGWTKWRLQYEQPATYWTAWGLLVFLPGAFLASMMH